MKVATIADLAYYGQLPAPHFDLQMAADTLGRSIALSKHVPMKRATFVCLLVKIISLKPYS